MILLLAQLASPPIQPGPARVPERVLNPSPQPASQPDSEKEPFLRLPSNESLTPVEENSSAAGSHYLTSTNAVNVVGDLPYSKDKLSELLKTCRKVNDQISRLQRCAEAITGLLQKDGYVNSRVFIDREKYPAIDSRYGATC